MLDLELAKRPSYKECKDAAFAMRRFGGSFMNVLGMLILEADDRNLSKIIDGWCEEIVLYNTIWMERKQKKR